MSATAKVGLKVTLGLMRSAAVKGRLSTRAGRRSECKKSVWTLNKYRQSNPRDKRCSRLFPYLTGTSAAPAGLHLSLIFTNIRRTVAWSVIWRLPFASTALKIVRSVANATFP
jgi:hypothetical protein